MKNFIGRWLKKFNPGETSVGCYLDSTDVNYNGWELDELIIYPGGICKIAYTEKKYTRGALNLTVYGIGVLRGLRRAQRLIKQKFNYKLRNTFEEKY
jgi:hypothetical protein